MKKPDKYYCEIHTANGKIEDVEMSGYSAEFVYRPPDINNLTPIQQEKLKYFTKMLNEEV